jgi:hypothetical protein
MQGVLVNKRAFYIFSDKMNKGKAKKLILEILSNPLTQLYSDEELATHGIKRVSYDEMGVGIKTN